MSNEDTRRAGNPFVDRLEIIRSGLVLVGCQTDRRYCRRRLQDSLFPLIQTIDYLWKEGAYRRLCGRQNMSECLRLIGSC
ncbi:hypothetical protein GWI33_006484 [Rhynchophorus ferrugineus]|uniref:Uncharacterized protein n=1 Tax=Rhynchophorus ferrugineus TaxID=354439 RepID=A0A834IIM0_RHYFE|nr:hypothetical protein GWI33_006484 [Rhynchophorus ferrugineus]